MLLLTVLIMFVISTFTLKLNMRLTGSNVK